MEHYTVGCGERDFQELGIECAYCWGLWDINRPLEGDCAEPAPDEGARPRVLGPPESSVSSVAAGLAIADGASQPGGGGRTQFQPEKTTTLLIFSLG
ncbi:Hypothetical predicted protein [Olea europaea subsp. europaea]|uniref:Uncharacterized protein n=1 Tax=Olea europaea subsp. europaea TaxID=158383 RepID=A0A8S0RSL3_OLEEU|nr:Hypothetical predicted protein [Olea europaea subsp. europaea]